MGELSLFTFGVMVERCLLIPVFLLLFFQVESCVNCSLLLTLFNFGFYWFSELIMLAVFLSLIGLSIPLEFYSFLASCICDYFLPCSMCISSLSILCNVGLVNMNCFSLYLSWKVFISPSRLKDSFAG
jgi:hypothetical protein